MKGRPKKPIPSGINLSLPTRDLAWKYDTSIVTILKWKRAAGITIARKGPPVGSSYTRPLWEKIRRRDWNKGCHHVAALMGVTYPAAAYWRKKLAIPESK